MAWWVVAGHAIQLCGIGNVLPSAVSKLLLHGSAAVNVFIILSGFVVTHLILDKREPYQLYLLRRGFRIVPIYFLCLLLAIAARPAFEFAYTSGNWASSKAWAAGSLDAASEKFVPHLILHLSLLHGVLPDSLLQYGSSTFLGPAWSISLEWQFYLLAPLIVSLLCFSLPVRITVTALFLGAVFAFKSGYFGAWQFPSMLLLSMHFFLIGIFCRLSLNAIEKLPPWVLPLMAIVTSLLLPAMRVELLLWSFFLTAAILEDGSIKDTSMLARVMLRVTANRPATLLGRVSYSTYLVHMPFWSVVIWSGNKLFGLYGQSATIALALLSMAALVPVSLLLYQFVERPFIRLGASLGSPGESESHILPVVSPVELLQTSLQKEKI